jgi:hypothetical protein
MDPSFGLHAISDGSAARSPKLNVINSLGQLNGIIVPPVPRRK